MGSNTVTVVGVKKHAAQTPAIGFIDRIVHNFKAWLRSRTGVANRSLHHVETLSLGPKRSLFLVECDGQRFLVAAAGDSISSPVPLSQENAIKQQKERETGS
jgi:flagellar biogenesis protein FliO